MRIFSYGAGVQSTAALVLAAQGVIDFSVFLFANVGNDSENPETIAYIQQIALPYAQEHGIDLIELSRPHGETLLGRITGESNRGFVIPAYIPTKKDPTKGSPAMRNCTQDFKVELIATYAATAGATKTNPAIIGLGISRDEAHRAKAPFHKFQVSAFPFLGISVDFEGRIKQELSTTEKALNLDRSACIEIIRNAGLPIPPKSSCWFCPYHSVSVWQNMREKQPVLFWKAVELEKVIQERQRMHNNPIPFLNRRLKPLAQLTTEDVKQDSLLGDDNCDSGYCFM